MTLESYKAELDRVIEAREKATSGEWGQIDEPCEVHAMEWAEGSGDPLHICEYVNNQENTDFIILAANTSAKIAAHLKIALAALEKYAQGQSLNSWDVEKIMMPNGHEDHIAGKAARKAIERILGKK